MHIYYTRKTALLIAGLVISASFLIGAGAFAGGKIPKPAIKPSLMEQVSVKKIVNGIPIPPRKPGDQKAQFVQVAMATQNELPPLPKIRSLTLNNVFSDKQARLYREIFDLQRAGDMKAADKKIARISNSVLMGHVLAERYLHPIAYKASYHELQRWMALYADHPQAQKIYDLALSRKMFGAAKKLQKPSFKKSISGNIVDTSKRGKLYKSHQNRTSAQEARVQKLRKDIYRHVERREPTIALNILSNNYAVQFMDDAEYDQLRALIASGYLYAGKLDQAMRLSEASLTRSGSHVPLAGWVKGLLHWREQDYQESALAFETAATSPYASGWMVSAAAYWASRANMQAGNSKLVGKWLNLAATYPRTFYGLIAMRAAGQDSDFNWRVPALTRDYVRFVEGTEPGQRAAALIKAGRRDLAEFELQNIDPGRSIKKQKALLAYAGYYRLPSLSMRLGNSFSNAKGGFYDAALYPIAPWQPDNGYKIDRALIHAIVRQESRFRVAAANPSGATGLMQLMPATANYISGSSIYENAGGQHQLKDPGTNLEIGQNYIMKLLNHKAVGQDLLFLAMAYNAGPGTLSRWKAQRQEIEDPLLFIETIPYNETRAFVERVLSNYWIYRMRLKQETPSLDAVAEGKWVRYIAQDEGSARFAAVR